jgi:hypothetical protein
MEYRNYIGFGVAGNFAGHLEQANEASDFKEVAVAESHAPKAIFPFYIPAASLDSFLTNYPISANKLKMPETEHNVQIEPEVALICHVKYDGQKVIAIEPKSFGAYNDCSIRRPGAKKISEKKNWGQESKGLSSQLIELDKFSDGGVLDNYSITSFHETAGTLHQYGEVSEVKTYSYFNEKLLNWVQDKMNNQQDKGPAEDISALLAASEQPENCILSIGATRYTDYGENNFLAKGDRSIVVVFDHTKYNNDQIIEFIKRDELEQDAISFLIQEVY